MENNITLTLEEQKHIIEVLNSNIAYIKQDLMKLGYKGLDLNKSQSELKEMYVKAVGVDKVEEAVLNISRLGKYYKDIHLQEYLDIVDKLKQDNQATV